MTTEAFSFVAPESNERRRAKYQLLLEKAKSIYFASQNLLGPTLMIRSEKPMETRIFDVVSKDDCPNPIINFCSTALVNKGPLEWLKAVIKFFYDNKTERFQLDLIALYFGKFRSFNFEN